MEEEDQEVEAVVAEAEDVDGDGEEVSNTDCTIISRMGRRF